MRELLDVPMDKRDFAWEQNFITALIQSKIRVPEEKAISGPDGFPYLMVETEGGDEPAHRVFDWLGQKGIGLVVNASKEPYPDLVMTFGMIWSMQTFGRIEIPFENFDKDFSVGEPKSEVLPTHVRKLIKQFFLDNGVLNLKFALVGRESGLELCFSEESLGNPPEKEKPGVAEAISWFLPVNLAVTLASEKELNGFVAV